MLLIITNSKDETANYLCGLLLEKKKIFLRFNTDNCLKKFKIVFEKNKLKLKFEKSSYDPLVFKTVWFRRPEEIPVNFSNDKYENKFIAGEWAEAFENYFSLIPFNRWVNHPISNSEALHKPEQLIRAKKVGLSVPASLVTQSRKSLKTFWKKCKKRIITKPLTFGYLERDKQKNDSCIYTNAVKEADLNSRALKNCPTYFQEEIEKKLDIRISIIDDHLEAASLFCLEKDGKQRLDIRKNNMVGVIHKKIEIPKNVKNKLIRLVRSYGLRFAAVDMVIDKKDKWFFLEINPNGQWAWLDLVGVTDFGPRLIEAFKN